MIRLVGGTAAGPWHDGAGAWPATIRHLVPPDQAIVVFDVLIPELINRIQGPCITKPMLLLSSLSRQRARMMAVDFGAIAYIAPALSKIELIDGIRASVRSNEAFNGLTPRLDCPSMSLDGRDVVVSGRTVDLSCREYAVLEVIVLYSGILLTKGALSRAMDAHLTKAIDVFGMAWERAA